MSISYQDLCTFMVSRWILLRMWNVSEWSCREIKTHILCGDFNFAPSYSMVETGYNMMFGIIVLLIISIFGGSSLMWLICPAPSLICLPYYLGFLTLFVVFIGGWLDYEIAGFGFGDKLFSIHLYVASSFAGSMWICTICFCLWCFFSPSGGWL